MSEYFFYIVGLFAFIILENRYLGVSEVLFFSGKFFNPLNEQVKFVCYVERLKSNCFVDEDTSESIVGSFDQNDSRLAFSDTSLLVGKRYFSYKYKIDFNDIVSVNSTLQNRFFFKTAQVSIKINKNNINCFLLFDYWIFSKRQYAKVDKIKYILSKKVSRKDKT